MATTYTDTEVSLVINNVPNEETLLSLAQGGLLQANQLYNTPDNSTPYIPVVANPSGEASTNLTKIQIDGTNYNIVGSGGGGSGGTTVIGNPSGIATEELIKISIDNTIYGIPTVTGLEIIRGV